MDVPIETKAAENQRKKQHQSFVNSCQISVADLYTFVPKLMNQTFDKHFQLIVEPLESCFNFCR